MLFKASVARALLPTFASALLLSIASLPAIAAWPDPAWTLNTPMTINNLGATLSDYQVKIALDGSFPFGSAKPDGSDLRVATSDELPADHTQPGHAPLHIDIVSAPKPGGSQASGILCGMRG